MKWDLEFKTNFLLGLFVASLISANLLGSKIAKLGVIEFSVGIFTYPLVVLITDIVQEIHGRKRANTFVWVSFWCVLIVMFITALSVWLPFAPRSYVQSSQYNPVFGMSIRFFIASIIAFLLSALHDVWAFNFWRVKTKGKWLWLRNNASSIVSQLIDTIVFMFIALYYIPGLPQIFNTSPKFTVLYLITLIIPYFLLKVIVIILHTPLCYLGVWWLKRK